MAWLWKLLKGVLSTRSISVWVLAAFIWWATQYGSRFPMIEWGSLLAWVIPLSILTKRVIQLRAPKVVAVTVSSILAAGLVWGFMPALAKAPLAVAPPPNDRDAYSDLKNMVAERGAASLDATTQLNADVKSVEARIQDAASSVSDDLKRRKTSQVLRLQEELRMQALAERMAVEYRPRLIELMRMIETVVDNATEQKLIELVEKTRLPDLPQKLAYTTFTLQEKNIGELDLFDKEMRFTFRDGVVWRVIPYVGRVRSPIELTNGYDLGVGQTYPGLQVRQERKDRQTTLAQIFFDPESRELSFNFSARHEVAKGSRDRLETIEKLHKGSDLVAQMLVELLRAVRLGDI